MSERNSPSPSPATKIILKLKNYQDGEAEAKSEADMKRVYGYLQNITERQNSIIHYCKIK